MDYYLTTDSFYIKSDIISKFCNVATFVTADFSSMTASPSRESNGRSASQEFTRLLRNPQILSRVQKSA